ncbi:MAG: hypothetical protein JWP97_5222, partial [Labilithrix sp.]|nr:hypothetical protein [Labilithrix sp.]
AVPGPATARVAGPVIPTFVPGDLPAAPDPLPAPPVRATASTPAGPSSAAAPAASVTGNDGEEIALLARAHEALSTSPATSLALCSEHGKRFAAPHFAQEREAVAIEALVYLGRTDEATRRLDAFRAQYPTSSHRAHLEDLISRPVAPR